MDTSPIKPFSHSYFSNKVFHILARLLVYSIALIQFSYVTADPDLWGHIKFGEDIWREGKVHVTDPYSYTAFGETWINHEWLTEVGFFLIFRFFDSTGLLAFKLLLGFAVIHLLSNYYFSRSNNYTAYFVTFPLITSVMGPAFMTRPHLLTLFFLTLLILQIQKHFDGAQKSLYWVPVIFLAWVNCHGGVVAGLGIFGVITFVEIIQKLITKEPFPKILLQCFMLSCVAVLINPYGYKLWLFFIQSLGLPRNISEWAPVPWRGWDFWQYKILSLLFVLSIFTTKNKRPWELLVLLFAIFYGYKHQRHTVLAVILLATYLPFQVTQWTEQINFKQVFSKLSNDFRSVTNACLVIFFLCQSYFLFNNYSGSKFKIMVEPQVYPTYLAQFMKANNIQGNLLVPFDWGEFFIWHFPLSKVAIDGRFRTVYPEKLIKLNEALRIQSDNNNILLEKFPTQYVVTALKSPFSKKMENLKNWEKIYQDPMSKLFVKKNEKGNAILNNFYKKNLENPKNPPSLTFPG